eukprot:6056135-Karenia_brevis.AAC.1
MRGRGRLNGSQLAAIEHSLGKTLTVIQGPPGTGKTKVSTSIITSLVAAYQHLLTSQYRCLLVCSQSHNAVDNIMVALLHQRVAMLRYGRSDKVRAELRPYLCGTSKELDQQLRLQFKCTCSFPQSPVKATRPLPTPSRNFDNREAKPLDRFWDEVRKAYRFNMGYILAKILIT